MDGHTFIEESMMRILLRYVFATASVFFLMGAGEARACNFTWSCVDLFSCYYCDAAVVTQSAECKAATQDKSQYATSCANGGSEKHCKLDVSAETVTKYTFSGNISYNDFGGLSAGWETQTTNLKKVEQDVKIGPLNCGSTPDPDANCCIEYYTLKKQVMKQQQCYKDYNCCDWGECEVGNRSGGGACCMLEGKLIEVKARIDGDCENSLTDCIDLTW